jgi:hypothetical protein
MMNQTDAFLRSLYVVSKLAAGGRLSAEQVNGLGETFQIAPAQVLNLVERLQSDGLVQLHWGGALSLTPDGRQRAEGGGAEGTPSARGGVSIGDIGAGATVVFDSPGAVAGYQATGAGATGAGAIRIEAPIGDLAAVLQALRSARAGLSGQAGEDAQALERELEAMLKHVQRPDPDKDGLQQSLGRSRSLLERLTQVGEITGKLKPVLDLAGVALRVPIAYNLGAQPMRILFLAANPKTTSHLDLEEELRSLESELRGVKYRDQVVLTARHAVRPDDLVRYVRSERPTVVHFSGHGSGQGIILRNDEGGYTEVTGASLQRFFLNRGVRLVVLNACYTQEQAKLLPGSVSAVVGTTEAVGDRAAQRFTVAFYRTLGDGHSIREAFRDGGDAVILDNREDVFWSDGELDQLLVTPAGS